MHKTQIILSGIGGQGIIALGSIIAEAAIEEENLYATLTSSYGVETRGTFTKSDIIISSEDIYYPEVLNADIVLCLAQEAYERYINNIPDDSVLIYDSSLIKKVMPDKNNQFGYEFTKMALDCGNVKAANIIALGILIKLRGILKEESVINIIKKKYKDNDDACKMNLKAFKIGIEIAQV